MKVIQLMVIFFIVSMHVNSSLYGQERIKLKTLKSKPIIEARLNGKPAYFLLDTGSDITMLHMKDHRKYDFQYYLKNEDHLINALSSENLVLYDTYDVNLTIGNHLIKANFYAYDLTPIVETLYKTSNLKICGIIGTDVMRSYDFVIDYNNGQIIINK